MRSTSTVQSRNTLNFFPSGGILGCYPPVTVSWRVSNLLNRLHFSLGMERAPRTLSSCLTRGVVYEI